VRGYVEVQQAPSLVRQDDEAEQDTKGRGGHHEEIQRRQILQVVLQEGAPRRRGSR